MGPGFPWTVVLSREQRDGLSWIQRSTPADAVVQAEPFVRGRTQWSLIPSFAERRMAAGQSYFAAVDARLRRRRAKVQAILRARSAKDAHAIARQLGIQYSGSMATTARLRAGHRRARRRARALHAGLQRGRGRRVRCR